MTRLWHAFKPQVVWTACAATVIALLVYGSIGHGWDDVGHQTLPGAVIALAFGIIGGVITAIIGTPALLIDGEWSQRRARYRALARPRVVAECRGDQVRIMRYGGGSHECELGRFHVDDPGAQEAAMDCMAQARANLKPKLDAEREAARLARVLNR